MSKLHITMGIVLAFALFPAVGSASHSPTDNPPIDFATGSGFVSTPNESLDFSLTASSGPLGENPTGTFNFFVRDTGTGSSGRVTCLHVAGNTATAIGVVEGGTYAPVGTELAFTVIDEAVAQPHPLDALAGPVPSPAGRGCEAPVIGDGGVASAFFNGGVVVHDGQPAPSEGGNGAHACKAERARIGEAAFAERYGTNGNGRNAFGKCVSEKNR